MYLYGCASEDCVNEHILLPVTFHLQQPSGIALNEIKKWTCHGMKWERENCEKNGCVVESIKWWLRGHGV